MSEKQGTKKTLENVLEYILFSTVFVIVALFVANLIDNVLNRFYEWIQGTFSINPSSILWLFGQVIFQVLITGAVSFYIRDLIKTLLMRYSTDTIVYGDAMYGILFAFITFFGQDHLKRRLSQINKIMDGR